MKARIARICPPEGGRIIAVSDVHGYVDYLEELLKKLYFNKSDMLILVGDLIEKGPRSLETVRYVLRQMESGAQVHAVMGNVEYDRLGAFFDDSGDGVRHFMDMLSYHIQRWKHGFFPDILTEMGIDAQALVRDWRDKRLQEDAVRDLKRRIREGYEKELDFLWHLPTVLLCGNFLFVHAGVSSDSLSKLQDEDAVSCMKRDAFLQEDVRFEKYVVVGHWPVCLYREEASVAPIFDERKHIIAIDGGCALKTAAQLNALVLPEGAEDMRGAFFESYDDFPVFIAPKDQPYRAPGMYVRYFDSRVEILERTEDMARLRHLGSGKEFLAPLAFLFHKNGEIHCDDYADTFLSVKTGDRLSVILENSFGKFVKKDGRIGWYAPSEVRI